MPDKEAPVHNVPVELYFKLKIFIREDVRKEVTENDVAELESLLLKKSGLGTYKIKCVYQYRRNGVWKFKARCRNKRYLDELTQVIRSLGDANNILNFKSSELTADIEFTWEKWTPPARYTMALVKGAKGVSANEKIQKSAVQKSGRKPAVHKAAAKQGKLFTQIIKSKTKSEVIDLTTED